MLRHRAFIRSHPVGELNAYIRDPEFPEYYISVLTVATGGLAAENEALPAGNAHMARIQTFWRFGLLTFLPQSSYYHSSDGDTPIVYTNDMQMLQMLVDAGADVNRERFQDGWRPVMKNNPEKTSFLVQNGADINAQDDKGETALIISSSWGRLENVRVLLNLGANQHTRLELQNCTGTQKKVLKMRAPSRMVPRVNGRSIYSMQGREYEREPRSVTKSQAA